jgi:hypothetical protein
MGRWFEISNLKLPLQSACLLPTCLLVNRSANQNGGPSVDFFPTPTLSIENRQSAISSLVNEFMAAFCARPHFDTGFEFRLRFLVTRHSSLVTFFLGGVNHWGGV